MQSISPKARSLRGGVVRARVLMFSLYFPPQYSGAAKQAISLGRELAERGHTIEFVTVRWPGLPSVETIEGFRVVRLEQGRGARHRELKLWWNLARYVYKRRMDFDFIHSHGAYYTNSFVGPLARCLGMRSLVKSSLANSDLCGIGTTRSGMVHKMMLKCVDGCVGISNELYSEFLSAGVERGKAFQIPNGVDCSRFRPPVDQMEKQVLRKRLNLPVDRKIALSVGVFDRRKNIGWLMDEWAKAKGFGSNGLLVAVGPQAREDEGGSYIKELDALALTCPEFLMRLDARDDVENIYRAADFFVLPSTNEGLPNVLLEAMASGLICAASDASGTRELITNGITGFSFPIGDAEALGRAIKCACSAKGTAIGAEGLRLVNSKYSIHAVADEYELLYSRLLSGRCQEVRSA